MREGMAQMNTQKKNVACMVLAALLAACILAGCGRGTSEKVSTNTVEGFLFSFDQREKTRQLSEAIADKDYPVKARWSFDTDSSKSETSGETDADETESVVHETEDEETIKEICLALSNAIIIDNAHDYSTKTPYFVELELSDGTVCRFDFVSRSVIRLSEQNYAVETDGNLWRLLGN